MAAAGDGFSGFKAEMSGAETENPVAGTAVAVSVDPDGPLAGVLLRGAPGSGKSSIALALIETCPWRRTRLVADDAVILSFRGGGLLAQTPAAIRGLIEIRGFGPARMAAASATPVTAVFDLDAANRRLPEEALFSHAGGEARLFPLAHDSGAEQRIRLILRSILAGQKP